MSRREIEDVLSSIRRLVTQDSAATAPDAAKAAIPSKAAMPPEKLILSPAFRVAPVRPQSDRDGAPEPESAAGPGKLESTIAELEAAISAIAEEWEPDCGDALPQGADSMDPDATAGPSAVTDTRGDGDAGATNEDSSARLRQLFPPELPPPPDPVSPLRLDQVFSRPPLTAGAGGALAPVPGHSNSSDTAGDALSPSATTPAEDSVQGAAGDATAGSADFAEAPMHVDAPVPDMPDNVRPFSPLSRFAPAAIEDTPQRPVPRPAAAEPLVAEPPVAETPAATFVRSSSVPRGEGAFPDSPHPQPAPGFEHQDASLVSEDDAGDIVMDEAMLRDLVAEILREELQGVLGQRITRNVRKMVRAEVARALASRNLD